MKTLMTTLAALLLSGAAARPRNSDPRTGICRCASRSTKPEHPYELLRGDKVVVKPSRMGFLLPRQGWFGTVRRRRGGLGSRTADRIALRRIRDPDAQTSTFDRDVAARLGRGVLDPQPLQRTLRHARQPQNDRRMAIRFRLFDDGLRIPLRIPRTAQSGLLRHRRRVHGVRHDGDPPPGGSPATTTPRSTTTPARALGDPRTHERVDYRQSLSQTAFFAHRRADLPAVENRRRTLHQSPRGGAGRLPGHAPRTR